MSKKFKIILTACLCIGIVAGLVEYLGPTLRVDKREATDVSALAPTVSAGGAILINMEDGRAIYEKEADKKLYPASTTKIMTALVAFEIMDEIGADLDSEVIVPTEAVGAEGSSIYLKENERLTMRELMYGMMLQSGNDAALAVAICSGGTLENFINRMNEKAEELGCKSTHFTNPNGLFDEEHYTTARDLSRIGRAAMKRDDFREIAGALSWKSEDTGRNFQNKNKTISQYEGATGIKIGYTKSSGRTLVASAKRGDTELIAVVLNDSNWFNDAYAMMDYGFLMAGESKTTESEEVD